MDDPALAVRYNSLLNVDRDDIKEFPILHYHAMRGRTEPTWRKLVRRTSWLGVPNLAQVDEIAAAIHHAAPTAPSHDEALPAAMADAA